MQWKVLCIVYPRISAKLLKTKGRKYSSVPTYVVVYARAKSYARTWDKKDGVLAYRQNPDKKEVWGPFIQVVTWPVVKNVTQGLFSKVDEREPRKPLRMTEEKQGLCFLKCSEDEEWLAEHADIVKEDAE